MDSLDNKKYIIKLTKRLEHNTINSIQIVNEPINYLILNFEETTSITLSGLMYIICLTSYYKDISYDYFNIRMYCEIVNLRDSLINFIMNFGFFQNMAEKGNLFKVNGRDILINNDLLVREQIYVNHQIGKKNLNTTEFNLIMPISTILKSEKRFFEYYVGQFRNRFSDFYVKLIELGFFNNSNLEYKEENFADFTKAVFEIIKNIYDHSNSWGIGAIHAKKNGVEIAYYDLGIGIANSMKNCHKYIGYSNIEAINAAFKDGVSSKIDNGDNKGRGFTQIYRFVERKNGYLSVRTDKYHFLNGKKKEINWFPGTQIVIYIPNE